MMSKSQAWVLYVAFFWINLASTVVVSAKLSSKMLAEPVESDEVDQYHGRWLRTVRRPRRRLLEQIMERHHASKIHTSDVAVFAGACAPDAPFKFPVSGHTHGLGAIGVQSIDSSDDVVLNAYMAHAGDGTLVLTGDVQGDFFASFDEDDAGNGSNAGPPMKSHRLEFDTVASNDTAVVECDKSCHVLVAYKDQSNVGTVQLTEANDEIRGRRLQSGRLKNFQQLQLHESSPSVAPLAAEVMQRLGTFETLSNSADAVSSLNVTNASENSITIESNIDGGVALVQVQLSDGRNGTVYRTVIVETGPAVPSDATDAAPFYVGSTKMNDVNDLEIQFAGLPEGVPLLLQCRVAIVPTAVARSNTSVTATVNNVADDFAMGVDAGDVDVRAIVDDGLLVVHGGWIRNRVAELGLTYRPDAFVVAIVEGLAQDPEHEYRIVAVLQGDDVIEQDGALMGGALSNGRASPRAFRDRNGALSAVPSTAEAQISDEMKRGRRPPALQRRMQSSTGNGKLILLHGYCATLNPWRLFPFSNAVEFLDPDRPISRSHYDYAKQVALFTAEYEACSILGHSQGGTAALTVYAYMWTCLDNSSNGRKIQTVGTPYQGTALAGQVAALAQIFGSGCGSNADFTPSGASSWLATIPDWARQAVTYYTTSFTDRWWSYDYCHLATDLFLSDPDDGVTSKSNAQLPGGINGGHATGWCHCPDMKYAAQYTDNARNTIMNNKAAR